MTPDKKNHKKYVVRNFKISVIQNEIPFGELSLVRAGGRGRGRGRGRDPYFYLETFC